MMTRRDNSDFTYLSCHPSLVDLLLHATNSDYLAGYDLNGKIERESYHSESLARLETDRDFTSLVNLFQVNLLLLNDSDHEPTLITVDNTTKETVVAKEDDITGRYYLVARDNKLSYSPLIPLRYLTSFLQNDS